MQNLDSQADGEQAAEGPGLIGSERLVAPASPTRFEITTAGRLAVAEDRLRELQVFLANRFGIHVSSPMNAPQVAMDKLTELQKLAVRGNGR